ncbi:autotransporter outer membrane beta-barrel domain-containing protein [uncultured Megasphaera sp.]|uniref:autotransporter outer membrane beta-barrel domain-containing protein n=1 Tax=uncultured Megasphaera sp. TaxID=165188 RepID=UPI0025D7ADAB|nr:autotransporter outer membrane beta-barrel domain-containing protein [uncultured Megasphaera sp.]
MRCKRWLSLAVIFGLLCGGTAGAADWQSEGQSLAAVQAGLATFYHMETDLFWRRSDDNRFASYKELTEPTDDPGWWVKTYYRSDTVPDDGSVSYTQDYSATLIGYDSQHTMARWGGTLRQGAFYTMSTSNVYTNAGTAGSTAYGGGSDSIKEYGGGFAMAWENKRDHHAEASLHLSQLQHNVSYSDSAGTSGLVNYRTWLMTASLRYYQTRLLPKQFFWEPQVGISLGYAFPYSASGNNFSYHAGSKPYLTGMAGVMAGRAYSLNGHTGLLYGRLGIQRELDGTTEGILRVGDGKTVTADVGDGHAAWYDMTLGTSLSLGKGNSIWGELTRRSGSDLESSWNINGGLVVKWGGAGKKEKEEMQKLKRDPRSMKIKLK